MAPHQHELGPDAQSLDAQRLLGGWRLISSTVGGVITPERGAKPTGLAFYDASGWVSIQFQRDGRQAPMTGDAPTPEEALAAVESYWAYFGTFTVDAGAKRVTHHRLGSLTPGWERHRDYVRAYEFAGENRLILRPVNNTNELVWDRLK